jgi:predicted HD phosphohydrolase
MTIVSRIEQLFLGRGSRLYEQTAPGKVVTVLQHALQCAQLAEWADADPSLVAAALLHDVGRLLVDGIDETRADGHELLAARFLELDFDPDVVQPIRLHVLAKRYLVTIDPSYVDKLSAASRHSLIREGGPLTEREVEDFEESPFAAQAVALRRWDDLARVPGKKTPPLDYYVDLLETFQQDPWEEVRTEIGSGSTV